MDRQVDHQAELIERDADRIDQKRHVVIDDLDHGMGRLPAMLLDLRVVDPDFRLAWPPLLAEAEMGQRRAIQIQRVAIEEIIQGDAAVVMAHERFRQYGLAIFQLVVQPTDHALQQVGSLVLQTGRH